MSAQCNVVELAICHATGHRTISSQSPPTAQTPLPGPCLTTGKNSIWKVVPCWRVGVESFARGQRGQKWETRHSGLATPNHGSATQLLATLQAAHAAKPGENPRRRQASRKGSQRYPNSPALQRLK